MLANALLWEHQTSTALQKNMSKMPQNQGRGLMLDWTRSQNARRTVGTVACFLPVLAPRQSCSGVPRRLLQSPESASPALPRNNHTAQCGLHYIRASSLYCQCIPRPSLPPPPPNAMLSRSSTVLAMLPTGFSRAGFYRGSGF